MGPYFCARSDSRIRPMYTAPGRAKIKSCMRLTDIRIKGSGLVFRDFLCVLVFSGFEDLGFGVQGLGLRV